ncbi:hypothetical protein DENIS_1137 [Desulfonema ishimotonii]|uniref:NERD domain-containing protein n=1 Tax=Desulfonema ishimotonii TaxID=45657 RepID=A0A401FTA0_9BACT|nr:hypothetical protein [Desulfonema ishimotonii]GBC60186.1 hypothetical protein DENIS_1137 [Desulfonema ishimotonii]
MTPIDEGALSFEFGEKWQVFKLDDHSYYRKGFEKLDGTKAVDFLGILNKKALYFIEVKDFRGHRIENKDRLITGELATEIAQKVRDSIACIIGAFQTENNPELWNVYARLLGAKPNSVRVVLWLETDSPISCLRMRQKVQASVKAKVFKQKLKWLTSRVLVCSLGANGIPDVEVCKRPSEK